MAKLLIYKDSGINLLVMRSYEAVTYKSKLIKLTLLHLGDPRSVNAKSWSLSVVCLCLPPPVPQDREILELRVRPRPCTPRPAPGWDAEGRHKRSSDGTDCKALWEGQSWDPAFQLF